MNGILDDCIFCKLANGIIPTDMVYQDDWVAAFKDLNPQAPVHVLIVPKPHFESTDEICETNSVFVAAVFEAIPVIAKKARSVGEIPHHHELRRGCRTEHQASPLPPSCRVPRAKGATNIKCLQSLRATNRFTT